jgi:hypothetical protein
MPKLSNPADGGTKCQRRLPVQYPQEFFP